MSGRIGKKRMIYGSAVIGLIGMVLLALAPSTGLALAFAVPIGVASGIFLAVDWALMTDIIPKAESGRYMGISNVVTGSAGAIATAVALVLMDAGNRAFGLGTGPRLAFAVACSYYVIGSLLLLASTSVAARTSRHRSTFRPSRAPLPPADRGPRAPAYGSSPTNVRIRVIGRGPVRQSARLACQVAGRSQRIGSLASHSQGTVAHSSTR